MESHTSQGPSQGPRDRLGRSLTIVLALVILVSAAWLRTYGLNWDEGTHLHPDERYLTMLAGAVEIPDSLATYWDTSRSPLNPTNRGYTNYVYGTLPLFATRSVGEWLDTACGNTPQPAARFARLLLMNSQAPCSEGTYTSYVGIHLVGRMLSAFVDLLTLVGLMLMAARLYNRRIAVLAGALYAFAVLPIQHAHFFVVDSFATVFVVWTLYLIVRAVMTGQRWSLALSGLTTGMAVASKISVWPLAGIVALGGILVREEETTDVSRPSVTSYTLTFALSAQSVIAVVMAGLLCMLAFRAMQPYAFEGPGFWDVGINPMWLETMKGIRELVSGRQDAPFGHQWANRPPIVFPWRNMVFWGMGLPLGLAAWLGWGAMGWDFIRNGNRRHLPIWVWGTGFFLYQGTQWVKSMRYLLPIYPVFVLCAAWVLGGRFLTSFGMTRSTFGMTRSTFGMTKPTSRMTGPAFGIAKRRWGRWFANRPRLWQRVRWGLTSVVLLGTMLWAIAFMQIYVRPLTRVEASRWMFDHIPTAVNLQTRAGRQIPVPMHPSLTLSTNTSLVNGPITLDTEATITHIAFPKAIGMGQEGGRVLRISITSSPNLEDTLLAQAQTSVDLPPMGTMPIYIAIPPVEAHAGQPIYLHIHLLEGGPMRFDTSVIANEHWDDSLPQRVDGKDPFSTWYRGLSTTTDGKMALYNEDTLQKREDLLQWLDEADYIVMSSNRLYASIPRLPMRFPMTIAYYEAMFDGSLGFELLAEFVSFPSLGPCQFPDQEAPFPIPEPRYTNSLPCSVPFPPAEEAFSVYDHPRVLIFAKTQDYAREKAEALLPPTLLANVEPMTALEATRGKKTETHTLLMDPRLEAVQEQGGTWSKLFPPNALQNRARAVGQLVAVVLWWLLLTALGWLAFPWLTLAFPALQNRGYGLARAVGLLLWAYPAWLLAALRIMPHTRLWLWIVFLGFALCTALLVYVRRGQIWTFMREHWRALLRIEVIFAALYLFWVLVRYLNPDLWHPVTGGEKPMDFAYLNAVIKSTWFPPYDPWFAGGIMNYYYFGFVLAGSLTEALGIMPSVAYNLIVPSFFAMTGVGAYTLAANLAGGSEVRRRRAGILGLFLVLLLGNLGEVRLIFNGLVELGGVEFTSLIPGYPALVSAIVGLWKVIVQGQMLRFRPEWWYWDATRVIPFEPGGAGPINEFPLFSFLYADLHAHMMAYPLTQVALGVALQWGLGERWRNSIKSSISQGIRNRIFWGRLGLSLGLGALAAGALRATNTWDYPTYLALMIVAFLMNFFHTLRKEQAEAPSRAVPPWVYLQCIMPVLLVALAELLFRPYTRNYAMAYSSFKLWNGMKTPLGIYLVMHGHFLFPLVILAGLQGSRVFRGFWGKRPTEAAIPSDSMSPEGNSELPEGSLGDSGLFRERVLSVGVVIVGVIALVATMVFLLDVAVAWLAVPLGTVAALIVLSPESSMRMRLLWFWIGTALALSLLVEVLVLSGDIGRMNTVFKFYLQVWMLLALSSAVAIERLVGKVSSSDEVSNPSLGGEVSTPLSVEVSAPSSDEVANPSLGEVSDRHPSRQLPAWFPDIILGGIAVLLLAAALYPLLAIPAKVRDRWNTSAPHTLDGARFIAYVTQHEHTSTIPLITDYKVIRWFQNHVAHTPVIIEGQAEREYLWGNRVSVHTGLPTVAAWRWHQVQQRMIMPSGTVEKRQFDIRDFYNTTNPERAMDILRQYEVSYVVLTPYERAYMVPEGEAKFTTLVAQGRLQVVYRDEDSTVYRVTEP